MDQPRISANLDKIEVLVDWLRFNTVMPPPTDVIYAAAGAVANLRHALCGGPDPVTGKIVPSRPASQTEEPLAYNAPWVFRRDCEHPEKCMLHGRCLEKRHARDCP